MTRNLSPKPTHSRKRTSKPLLIAWGIFIALLFIALDWALLSPSPKSQIKQTALVLDLPPATPLEEFIFTSSDETEDMIISDGSETIWELVDPQLVEETDIGLLPTVGSDGLTPWQAYGFQTDADNAKPKIALILTDLGPNPIVTSQAIEQLPSPVSLAFSPYTAAINQCIQQARDYHHDTLLNVALESDEPSANNLSPHALLTHLSVKENRQRLAWILSQTGGYVGIVASQGKPFLDSSESAKPILEELHKRGLIFVETQHPQFASMTSQEVPLPRLTCTHPLDPSLNLARQLQSLETAARRQGHVIAMIHAPTPATLEALQSWIQTLEKKSIILVSVTTLMPDPQRLEKPAVVMKPREIKREDP